MPEAFNYHSEAASESIAEYNPHTNRVRGRVIRHGEPEDYGANEAILSDEGIQQAYFVGLDCAELDAFYPDGDSEKEYRRHTEAKYVVCPPFVTDGLYDMLKEGIAHADKLPLEPTQTGKGLSREGAEALITKQQKQRIGIDIISGRIRAFETHIAFMKGYKHMLPSYFSAEEIAAMYFNPVYPHAILSPRNTFDAMERFGIADKHQRLAAWMLLDTDAELAEAARKKGCITPQDIRNGLEALQDELNDRYAPLLAQGVIFDLRMWAHEPQVAAITRADTGFGYCTIATLGERGETAKIFRSMWPNDASKRHGGFEALKHLNAPDSSTI